MGDDCEDPNDFKLDILGWWRCNATKYKILSKVAQHVLAIPVSTVVSEAAFSTGGRILDPFEALYLHRQCKHWFVVRIG